MASTAVAFPVEGTEQTASATDQIAPVDPFRDLAADDLELQNCIKGLVQHFLGLDKWVERQEVIESRLQRFYWRDVQYIFWKSDSSGFLPAIAGSTVDTSEGPITLPRYTDVYNIYTPFGESLIAVLTQNVPGVNWRPVDMSKGEDITAAQASEKYQQKLDRDNNRKELQTAACRLMYTDGRVTFFTEQKRDGTQSIKSFGVLETKPVPIMAKCREELVAYFISDEVDVYKAKEEYSDFKSKIKEGNSSLGESPYKRIARLGVLQGTRAVMQAGDAFSHMTTRHRAFLRPSCFEKAEEKFRDKLSELYKNGLYVTFCGDSYCGSFNESMDDHLTIDFATPGDGMNRSSLGKRVVPLQDVFNDELNLWHEAHDHCIPTLFMYSETGDIDAIREQVAEPGNIIPFTVLPPGANSAADAFYAAVLEGIPATLPQFVQFIQGPLAQFISGAFPALFGGDTKENDTAKGIAIQRDQAMGRMGLPWGALQRLFAGAYTQAVGLAKRHAQEGDKFNYATEDLAGNALNEEVPMDDLRLGGAHCLADVDASFPESNTSKRQTFQLLMAAAERNPILAEIIAQPDNQEFAHEVLGLPDLVIPAAAARNKQFIEIDQLLKEEPVPATIEEIKQASLQNPALLMAMADWEQKAQLAIASGQLPPEMPIPPELSHPSIPVDAQFDFHQYEFQAIKDWLSSPQRREAEKISPKGVLNVRLHGLMHQALIPPPMPVSEPNKPNHKAGPSEAGEKLQQKTENQPAQLAPQEKLS
jgi:hypothetical protein